jgi:alkyl sulfatase BDS1-like metallo-beta-lactamase superfamily hydrolase
MASTQELIETAVRRFQQQVPALANLKLVFELELQGRRDVQMYRVEVPGPKVTKGVAQDARATVSIPRAEFNLLATEGTTKSYREAVEHGQIKASGDPNLLKLIAQVVDRHDQRARLKKVR